MDCRPEAQAAMSGPQQMHEVWIDTAEGGQSLWQVSQRKLGQGAFADVYEARGPGGQSAVAKVSVEPFENEGRDGEAVALQASQGHPSIVRYLGEGSVGNKRVLLLEHVRGGDLMDRVLKHSALVEHEAARAISQLLAALDHIQSRGVCHGDLKPENILCTVCADEAPLDIKLADFGSALCRDCACAAPCACAESTPRACDLGSSRRLCGGTALYAAPELADGALEWNARAMSDMWSAGVIAYVLLSGAFPYSSADDARARPPRFDEAKWASVSTNAKDFIRTLVVADPHARPTARQALRHPWLRCCSPPPMHAPLVDSPPSAIVRRIARLERSGCRSKRRRKDAPADCERRAPVPPLDFPLVTLPLRSPTASPPLTPP